MITKYISSDIIIPRIEEDYNIQSSDYITRVATWVYNCIRDISIKQIYAIQGIQGTIDEYRYKLPDNVEKVFGVYIDNQKAKYSICKLIAIDYEKYGCSEVVGIDGKVYPNETNIIDIYTIEEKESQSNTKISNDYDQIFNPFNNQNLKDWLLYVPNFNIPSNNCIRDDLRYDLEYGWIKTTVRNGDIKIITGSRPVIYNSNLDQMFPVIPDDQNFITACIQYCLRQILIRGYKHPVLSLTSNNKDINPSLAYDRYRKLAQVSCNTLSNDARIELSKLIGMSVM